MLKLKDVIVSVAIALAVALLMAPLAAYANVPGDVEPHTICDPGGIE